MSGILTRLGQVTVADIWASLWRAMVWVGLIRLMAYWLDIPWSWTLFGLIVFGDLVSHMLYYTSRSSNGERV